MAKMTEKSISLEENASSSEGRRGVNGFLLNVNVSDILSREKRLDGDDYSVLVDYSQMTTIQDFKEKLKLLFDLKRNVVCMNGKSIVADKESIKVLWLIESLRVKFSAVVNDTRGPAEILDAGNDKLAQLLPEFQLEEQVAPKSAEENKTEVAEPLALPKRKKYVRTFSIGELLNDLRTRKNQAPDQPDESAEELSNTSTSLPSVVKRKRTRRHKSKKSATELPAAAAPAPVLSSPYSFETAEKPKHLRFSTSEEPMSPMDESVDDTDSTAPVVVSSTPEPACLEALFSLRKVHGTPPMFVRNPLSSTYAATQEVASSF